MSILTRKPGCKEDGRDFSRQRFPDYSSAETQDVHVVMLDGLVGGVRVVADGCPDPREFVGGDRDAGTAAAQQETAVDAMVGKGRGHRLGAVRIVDCRSRMGPEVDHLMAQGLKDRHKVAFQFERRVVGGYSNTHR